MVTLIALFVWMPSRKEETSRESLEQNKVKVNKGVLIYVTAKVRKSDSHSDSSAQSVVLKHSGVRIKLVWGIGNVSWA